MNKKLTQILYFIIAILSSCLVIVKTGFYASFLSIESYSILNKFFLFALTFLQYGGLGLQYSLQKYLPQLYAKNEEKSSFDIIIITISLYLLTGILSSLLFLFFVLYSHEYLIFILVPFYMFSQLIFFIVLTQQRSRMNFLAYSITNFSKSLVTLILIFLMTKLTLNIRWYILLEITINCFFSYSIFNVYFKWLFTFPTNKLSYLRIQLKKYIVSGVKLLLNNGMTFALLSLDKWLALIMLSTKDYGLYSFALVFLTASETVQQVLNISLYSYFGKLFADDKSQIAFKIAKYTFIIIGALGCIFYIPLLRILDWGVIQYFPKYSEIISIVYLIILSGVIRCSNFFTSYCIMADMEIKLSASLLVFIVSFTALFGGIVFHGARIDLNTIAMISVITSTYLVSISFIYAWYHNRVEKKLKLRLIESI